MSDFLFYSREELEEKAERLEAENQELRLAISQASALLSDSANPFDRACMILRETTKTPPTEAR